MKIQIVLTDYILKFMYGDQTFQDQRLLSLEVMKKAYQEGLYFISKKENIDQILKNRKFKSKNIFAFAGIPTLEEAVLDLSIQKELYAIKMFFPYEVLVDFSFDENNKTLNKRVKQLPEMHQAKLKLSITDKEIVYEETEEEDNKTFTQEEEQELITHFTKKMEEYHYILIKKLEELRGVLVTFLTSKESMSALENEESLESLALLYEDLESCFKK
ncbi:MAG: hypothetical protein IJ743_02150 [Bacilli bacterium]|nr:hypothetical protein [Bacilli bacterium]MBR1818486.1 hypothetical protein [Bacilli bacterium]